MIFQRMLLLACFGIGGCNAVGLAIDAPDATESADMLLGACDSQSAVNRRCVDGQMQICPAATNTWTRTDVCNASKCVSDPFVHCM